MSAVSKPSLTAFMVAALHLAALGCGRTVAKADGAAPTPAPREAASTDDPQVAETIALHGFEQAAVNDPELRKMRDGSLVVVFNCMPPCSSDESAFDGQAGLGPYAHFDAEMQKAVGVDVLWEDREFFRIRQPRADTVQRVKDFVAHYHDNARAK